MFETLGRREVGEGGEDVELLDGWVSALEEGDRVVKLICTGFFVFIIFLFRIL